MWLDRYQIGQLMISRPIVAAPLLGGALGDFSAGLAVGVLFEVLWLRRPPTGGFIAPDVTFSSAVASAVAIIVRNQIDFDMRALALLSFIVCMPLSFIGSKLDLLLRLCLGKMSSPAERAILERDGPKITFFFIFSLIIGFAICLTAQVPIIIAGTFFIRYLVNIWPENFTEALKFAYFTIPAIGALDVLAGNLERFSLTFFLIGLGSTLCCYIFL